jgi:hypothetical protein
MNYELLFNMESRSVLTLTRNCELFLNKKVWENNNNSFYASLQPGWSEDR